MSISSFRKFVVSGEHRKGQWEDGWEENLQEYIETKSLKSLIPKYYNKENITRLRGNFVISDSDDFELEVVSLMLYLIHEKYFAYADNIYEFGAGTGHNLLKLRDINKSANLYSMEWTQSGVNLINRVSKHTNDDNLYGVLFDNFNPDWSVKLKHDSSVYTVHALEQLGEKTDEIINYWIENKPKIIVNIEPMSDTLDQDDLLQYLSIKYAEKRGYLKNYIAKLRSLEKEGIVTIHDVYRTGVGSLFIESCSVVIWSPNSN